MKKRNEEDSIAKKDAAEFASYVAKKYKKGYDIASKRDKAKLLFIFLSLSISFVIAIIGIVLEKVGDFYEDYPIRTSGFILMGVGFGAFVLAIISIPLVSKLSNWKRK